MPKGRVVFPAHFGDSLWKKAATAIVFQQIVGGVNTTFAIDGYTSGVIASQAAALNTDDIIFNAATVYVAALGGGKIYVEEADYNLAATWNVSVDIFVQGAGSDAILNYDAGGNCITITGDNVKIRDLKIVIVAGAGGAGTRPNGFYATARTNVEITNLWLVGDETEADDGSDSRQCGILFGINMAYSKIAFCTIEDFDRHGISFVGTAGNEVVHVEVEGNICYSNITYGISLEYALHCTLTGNTCQGNSRGIQLSSSSDNTVTGNTCQGNSYGISLGASSDNNTLVGNTCQGNTMDGILLNQSDNNTLTGNTCQRNSQYGIQLSAVSDNTVTGNTCYQNLQDGIHIDIGSGNTIVGNTCNENDYNDTASFDGISIEDDSDYNIVHSNTCNDNDRWGISIGVAADDCVGNWVKNKHLRGNTSGAFIDNGTDTKVHEIHETVENPNSFIGRHPAEQMLDNVETTVRMGFSLPLEFQQIVTAQVVIVAATAGDLRWDALTDFGKLCSTEEYNEHNDSVGATTTGVLIDDLTCIDVSAALTDVAPGDRVGLEFWRDGDDDLDTIGDTVYVLEIRIRYV